MKANKFLFVVTLASVMLAGIAQAGSIGRSSSSSSHSSSSVSRSSSFSAPSRPSTPSVAPAPSRPGGIGGTQGSIGVRKSEVTAPVAQQVRPTSPTPSTVPHSTPAPSYGYAPVPAPSVTNGSTFMSSLGGSFAGSMLGNMMFSGNRGGYGGGTTVVNNGGGTYQSEGNASGGTSVVQQKESYGMGHFILDVILFAVLVIVVVGIVFLFYKLFKVSKEYVNKERGVSNQPFNPTQVFWEIQKAFAAGDVTSLKTLLGPDIVDEMIADLQPSTLTLSGVSHEVRLSNNTEFSVWYKFTDAGEEVNQVWHYEKRNGIWALNGIETV